MTARAYYNEVDPYAAQWLRNLIDAGYIASGDVDERSVLDVRPADIDGYTQCLFTTWSSLALRRSTALLCVKKMLQSVKHWVNVSHD